MDKKRQKVEKRVSAGGIIFRKKNNKIEFLILEKTKEDGSKEWLLPKGEIEEDEDKKITALREASEETNLPTSELEFIKEIGEEKFFYKDKWGSGNLVFKKVFYFLIKYNGKEKPKPQRKEGFTNAVFFDFQKTLQMLTYKNSQELIKKAIKEIKDDKR